MHSKRQSVRASATCATPQQIVGSRIRDNVFIDNETSANNLLATLEETSHKFLPKLKRKYFITNYLCDPVSTRVCLVLYVFASQTHPPFKPEQIVVLILWHSVAWLLISDDWRELFLSTDFPQMHKKSLKKRSKSKSIFCVQIFTCLFICLYIFLFDIVFLMPFFIFKRICMKF